MKLKDLQKKDKKDLLKLLSESRDKLREFRFQVSNRQLKNIREIRETKKIIARILTLLNK